MAQAMLFSAAMSVRFFDSKPGNDSRSGARGATRPTPRKEFCDFRPTRDAAARHCNINHFHRVEGGFCQSDTYKPASHNSDTLIGSTPIFSFSARSQSRRTMRKTFYAILGMAVSLVAPLAGHAADRTAEYSVQVSADVKASPAQITLSWPQDSFSTPKNYTIYRRAPGTTSWGAGTTLSGATTTYVDKHVSVGVPYEYQIVKHANGFNGYGYIYSGIDVPLTENRGTLLLVVDNTYADQLDKGLTRLQQDLVGDGWTVSRIDVDRDDTPVHVKSLIKAKYDEDPANTKAVFLFGHVPVPYSGDIVPDGHYANHQGAWPCDGYYADMVGTWTDTTVNDTTAEDPRNHNVPGDGKFDQSTFPAPLKLAVGRVDLANMPGRLSAGGPATFPSELELLRNYLNKD